MHAYITLLLAVCALIAGCDFSDAGWKGWPFTTGGYAGGALPMVAKFLFVGLIFAAVVFFLRFLFGPGGRFREDWIDEDNARLRAEEKERLEEMDRQGIPRPRKGLTERLLERLAGIGNRDKDGR